MDEVQFIPAPPRVAGAGLGQALPPAHDDPARLDSVAAVVIDKHVAGLPLDWVDHARQVIRSAAEGRLGPLQFLVFDLAADAQPSPASSREAALLIRDIGNLILDAPIITVAYVDRFAGGADLDLALACSMLICDEGAEFSFAGDPVVSVAAYALLAQKIGFVRAERLMEREQVLTAGQMRDLFLLKETTAAGSGLAGLELFLQRTSRRHNSAAAMYRAQRMASPLAPLIFGEMVRN